MGMKIPELWIRKEQFDKIRKEVTESNRRAMTLFSLVTSVIMLVLLVVIMRSGENQDNLILYITGFLISLGVFGLMMTGQDRVVMPCVYLFGIMLFGFGIALGTVGNPDEAATTFMVMMVAVPLMFGERPIRMNTLITIAAIVFVICTSMIKNEHLRFVDTINGITFCILALLMNTYMMRIKLERYQYEYEIRRSYAYDRLTGLHSRNVFEEKLEQFAESFQETISCIFLDVDGLHELNHIRGHKAGDTMLIAAAELFQNLFGEEGTYRIGGDEFVAVLADQQTGTIEEKIRELEEQVISIGYHISVGHCTQRRENYDLSALMREAESEMFRRKRAYYSQEGNDRRSRE